MAQTFVISLGGSLFALPKGLDKQYINRLVGFIKKQAESGQRMLIVMGGGQLCRDYIKAAPEARRDDQDWVGIMSTRLNAELLRAKLGALAYHEVVIDPTRKLSFRQPIIIAAGYKPGWSTDYVAVMIARTNGIRSIINMTNVDYVYSADPKKDRSARPLSEITWTDFKRLVGGKWQPGLNSPFDPIASKLAASEKMRVDILNGRNLQNLAACLSGRSFKGTRIE